MLKYERTAMKDKTKDFIFFILAIIIFYALLFALGFTCPIKALTGISCPSCGMTRAYFSLLRLKPSLAFAYHPLFPLPAIVLVAYIFRGKLSDRFKKIAIILGLILVFAVYFIRMADPSDDIVVCRPRDSIIYKAYENLIKK